MGIHRDLAIAAMTAIEPPSGFDPNEFAPVDDLPRPVVPGALPAMGRAFVPAAVFKLPVQVLMFWGLGMRRVAPQVTLAWGTLCPATDAGRTVLRTIIEALGRSYLTAGGP